MTRPVNRKDIPLQPTMVSPWMTLGEVASYWRCSKATVLRKAGEGYLKPTYLPGSSSKPLFHRDQVVAALPWPEPEGLRTPLALPAPVADQLATLSPLAQQLAGLKPRTEDA